MTLSPYLSRKPNNPNHHNVGRKQSPRHNYAATLSWWNFQLKAAIGNLRIASARSVHHPESRHVLLNDLQELRVLYRRQQRLLDELEDIQREVAEWNVRKKWVD